MDRHRNKTTIWISWSGCIFNTTNLEEISEENWVHIFHPRKSYEHLKTCWERFQVGNVDLWRVNLKRGFVETILIEFIAVSPG